MFISDSYNFKTKFILSQHLESDEERKYASGELKLLFAETRNRCGYCGKPLDWKLSTSIDSKKNQIAHIYGKKLFAKAKLPLDKEYHISDISELNQYHNLIILCDQCHHNYDNDPTYEKYVKMLSSKEIIAKRVTAKTFIYFALEDILKKIETGAFDKLLASDPESIENFRKVELINKLSFNDISVLKTNKIISDMAMYFKVIKEIIDELDKEKKYLKKYNDTYIQLKSVYKDKNEILNLIDNSLIEKDYNVFSDVIPIITSYMIMNCEVLDNVAK